MGASCCLLLFIMSFTKLLGIQFPLIQAPMAGIQTHAMAAAVCNTGGLGSLPCAMLSPDVMAAELAALSQATTAPYNVNFFCHTPPESDPVAQRAWQQTLTPYYAEFGIDPNTIPAGVGRLPFSQAAIDVLKQFKPKVVSFHFGLPAPELLAQVKSWGALVIANATTVAEARWLEARGADAIIAQGVEAGGHRGLFLSTDLTTQIGTFALLPQVIQAVRVPVIAAGGIADAAGVAAAMQFGATAVQVGTSYMLCDEAFTSPMHRAALQSEAAEHTALTTLFTGRPARGIMNRLMRELGPLNAAAPAFPTAINAIAPLRAAAEAKGSGDFSPLWSGQNARGCQAVSATTMTQSLAKGFSL